MCFYSIFVILGKFDKPFENALTITLYVTDSKFQKGIKGLYFNCAHIKILEQNWKYLFLR